MVSSAHRTPGSKLKGLGLHVKHRVWGLGGRGSEGKGVGVGEWVEGVV